MVSFHLMSTRVCCCHSIFVLCCVVYQNNVCIFQQINFADTFPARIFAQQKTITEDSDLYVTCSTFGIKKQTMVYVYLCKDDVGINVVKQEKEQYDNLFIIQRVVHHRSGYYSCVYSKTKYEPSVVVETGSTKIQILVIRKYFHSYESIISMPCSFYLFSTSAMQPVFSLQIFQ